MPSYKYVGTDIPRKDGVEKVTGSARYIEDLHFAPLLYAKVKKSPIAHGRIKRIDTSKAEAYPGVRAVVTGKDFPHRAGLYLLDRTYYAVDKVRYWGEPVAAVVTDWALAANRVREDISPISDLRGSREYRYHVAVVLVRRGLEQVMEV